ncbi:hypothetical protein AGMMS49944_18640 [Spirochaetia bacterium]|nr:hypothetical protein AGMMS49944_18640 [Spirochaetia bacterium]
MTQVFLDFDGTIVNVWKRYYKIFCDFYKIDLNFELYKKEKKLLQDDYLLAKKHTTTNYFSDYKIYKTNSLENLDYLQLDTLILDRCRNIKDCKILTYRNKPDNLFLQMNYLGLNLDTKNVIILNPMTITKKDYLLGYADAIIVGDSESEYVCADNKNTAVFLVKTGLRNVEAYTYRKNVQVIEDINHFFNKKLHGEYVLV